MSEFMVTREKPRKRGEDEDAPDELTAVFRGANARERADKYARMICEMDVGQVVYIYDITAAKRAVAYQTQTQTVG